MSLPTDLPIPTSQLQTCPQVKTLRTGQNSRSYWCMGAPLKGGSTSGGTAGIPYWLLCVMCPPPPLPVTAPSNCQRPYDSSHIPHHLTSNSASLQYTSVFPGWWDCLSLPDSLQALNKLQLPRPEKDNLRFPQRFTGRDGLCSPGLPSPSALSALLSPTSKKAGR